MQSLGSKRVFRDQPPAVKAGEQYPAGLSAGKPAADRPMQRLGPAAAIYVARLVGCRLPTPAEWKAALAVPDPDRKPNLRGATWKRQRDHIAASIARLVPKKEPDT